jgi:hypothetical protein
MFPNSPSMFGSLVMLPKAAEQPTNPNAPPESYQREQAGTPITSPAVNYAASQISLEEVRALAQRLGISDDRAAQLHEAYSGEFKRTVASLEKTWQADVEGWKKQSLADPEIGGPSGPGIAAARHIAQEFGTPGLFQLLNSSGFSAHPEVLRFLVRSGRALQEARRGRP